MASRVDGEMSQATSWSYLSASLLRYQKGKEIYNF